jgi:hypothetical protein
MRRTPRRRAVLYVLIVVVGILAPTTIDAQSPALDPLALPSFAIFELSAETVPYDLEQKYRARELAGMRAALEKQRAETIQSTTDETVKTRARDNRLFYFMVPITFYASRHLFAKETWTDEELREGQQLAAFIAWIAGKPELTIANTERAAFRAGLVKLRNWFVAVCRDNKTLPAMLLLTDDLFYGGQDIDIARVTQLTPVQTMAIPDTQASFVLLTDGAKPEPLIIGVINADGSARWLKRYSGAPLGAITSATAHEYGIKKLDGHGYVCWVRASWDFGTESSRIYLDESLNLRFYYLSW